MPNAKSKHWFNVDKDGLAQLMERRGKSFIACELLQNAWDANDATAVDVTMVAVPGRALVDITVVDDSPGGFASLDAAFTLFGKSDKRGDATKRGRFCMGEKMVLALCEEATIRTTKGAVRFDASGRHVTRSGATACGSQVTLRLRATREDLAGMLSAVHGLIPPIPTTVNGEPLQTRTPLRTIDVTLPTESADADGILRRSRRLTTVRLYQPEDGEVPKVYEMGIPVVEIPDPFHIEVCQRVPLSMERDGVTPAYLRQLRTAVLNAASDLLDAETAAQPWVAEAMAHKDAAPEAVRTAVQARFGDNVVSYDPSDREANSRAAAAGYAVVHGGTFNTDQWQAIRDSSAIEPAGRVFPTHNPIFGGDKPDYVPTPQMLSFADTAQRLGYALLDTPITVRFVSAITQSFAACFGGRVLTYNVGRIGKAHFNGPLCAEQLDLLVHELAHHYESNHLSDGYYKALSRLAGRMAMLALAEPDLFVLTSGASTASVLREPTGRVASVVAR